MPLVVNTVSDSRDAQKDLAKLKDSINNIESSIRDTTSAFAKFSAGIAASMAVVSSLKELTSMSDRFTNLENKIKSVTDSTTQFKQALQGVKDIAISTRSDLNATASLYQKIAINQKEIGINTKDTLRVVEIVGKALKLSGANAQESAAAMLQFGQALGSGKLQGDELKSLAENAPMLVKAIADGIGISVGKLKEAGADGKLAVNKILPGIIKKGGEIDAKFATLGVTFGDAFKNLKLGFDLMANSFSKFLFGTGNGFASFVNDIGKKLADVSKYFGAYMALARSHVTVFVLKTMILFEDLWPTIKEFASNVADAFAMFVSEWTPNFIAAGNFVKNWFTEILVTASLFSKEFFNILYQTDFGKAIIEIF